MKYNAPYGSADPDAAYVDRNTPGAVSGSRVPAKAIELPQREIVAVINSAGLLPDNADPTQLLQAITAIVNAATGGAGDPNYVLMTQARVRLPIFPEILTSDGKLPCLSPATGTVRVPAGYSFLHRGIYSVTTVETDFATTASKTYHLRWNPTAGYVLKDLADAGYNPSALAEADAAFDSVYDDMLIAKVVTNASNVSTVTNLVNRDRLFGHVVVVGTAQASNGNNGARFGFAASLNWARAPRSKTYNEMNVGIDDSFSDHDRSFYAPYPTQVTELPATRYGTSFEMMLDYVTNITMALDFGA